MSKRRMVSMDKRFLKKSEIMELNDLEIHELEIPEWGGIVRVKNISGNQRDKWEMGVAQRQNGKGGTDLIRASLVALCIVDEEGKPMFSRHDIEDLGKKSSKALDRIYSFSLKMNGIGQNDIEELAKN